MSNHVAGGCRQKTQSSSVLNSNMSAVTQSGRDSRKMSDDERERLQCPALQSAALALLINPQAAMKL